MRVAGNMTVREILRDVRERFTREEIPSVDGELLIAHVLGTTRMELHSKEFQLTDEQREEFQRLVNDRRAGIPTQYLIGKAPFRYLEFDVGPGVLIPRPETELLVDLALAEIERMARPISIVDLGSGSGALAISVAHESRQRGFQVSVVAVEKEAEALPWLRRNIAMHDVDVRVIESDVADALIGVRADLILANPPYIPDNAQLPSLVVDNEPSAALFGGSEDGLEIPLHFITAATRLLKPDGVLIVEHHESQRERLEAILASDYGVMMSHRDLNGRDRVISARRKI